MSNMSGTGATKASVLCVINFWVGFLTVIAAAAGAGGAFVPFVVRTRAAVPCGVGLTTGGVPASILVFFFARAA